MLEQELSEFQILRERVTAEGLGWLEQGLETGVTCLYLISFTDNNYCFKPALS